MANTEKQDNSYREAFGNLRRRVDWLQAVTSTALIALAIGFIAVFVSAVAIFHDAYTNKAATYLELTEEVRDINQKVEILSEMCLPK